MRSIRTKITALMLAAILISITSFGLIGIYFTVTESTRMSARDLYLICENRKASLNEFLESIEQSVSMIARYATDSLDGIALTEGGVLGATGSGVREISGRTDDQRQALDRYFDEHLAMVELAFKSVANHTNGVSTCYYRINPELTTTAKGFYYAKKDNIEFRKLELTEIEKYKSDDLEHVGWYFIPLKTGRPTWIRPYNTANPGGLVMSFAVPMYKAGTFIGVIGMDIEFDTLVKQIQQFTDFNTGYFVLADEEGRLYYHPEFTMDKEPASAFPEVMRAVKDLRSESSGQELISYNRNGEKWQMTYATLKNDLKLAAIVKESEINTATYRLINVFVTAGVVIMLAFALFTAVSMRRLTDPLKKLTAAAGKLAAGDYDVELDYVHNDEVGELTKSFCSMRDRLRTTFAELSDNKEKLQEALIVSQQANRAKTVFLSNMSHEIRTPLNAIIGFAYLAEQDIDDKELVYDSIQKISISGKHLLSMINKVLDVSRTESGRMVFTKKNSVSRDCWNRSTR